MGPRNRHQLEPRLRISIHPSRVGWDAMRWPGRLSGSRFQSTHPVWDGTHRRLASSNESRHFNPPIPCGMGPSTTRQITPSTLFQSTHPVWDGTLKFRFTNTFNLISIHPSRVGWDFSPIFRAFCPCDFNPPIPCGMGPSLSALTRCSTSISIHPSRVGWDSKKYMITYISCDSYPFCQIFRLHKMTAYSYS